VLEVKSLVSISDLTSDDILTLMEKSLSLKRTMDSPCVSLNKILVNVFLEPSTRTASSFTAAMYRLGGRVISLPSKESTSLAKGESFEDTLKIMSSYGDALVLRSSQRGDAEKASRFCDIPVINAGDGDNEHPTQTLTDLFTLYENRGTLEGLRVTLVGDLKHGRTVHSLVKALGLFKGTEIFCLPEPGLNLPREYGSYPELGSIEEACKQSDVLYMTRTQKERIGEPKEGERWLHHVLTRKVLDSASPDLMILHPLPRNQEIPVEVDATPHARYFDQSKNGVPVRMAILKRALGL
jgi:aspartate carbamoyltransferase catalytic subunit